MAKEIERKFIVISDRWDQKGRKTFIKQAYISDDPERTVRVRISGKSAFLTIKGKSQGLTRDEFNFRIPKSEAEELFRLSINSIIEKVRYHVDFNGKTWEVDEFKGENEGLVLAEVELFSENEIIKLPGWAGEEVTGDVRYFNSYLSKYPYKTWK